MFKDVRQGQTIHILDRTNLSLVEARCTQVGIPYYDTRNVGVNKMVVDITLDDGSGSQRTYTVPDRVEVAYAADKILAVVRSYLTTEVESICAESQKILDSVDAHKDRVEKGKALLSELNPVIKERQQTEERFNKIESSIDELKNLIISKCTTV